VAWIAIVLATQAWPSWETGIRELFASDVSSYQRIAEAAPGLPTAPVPAQHAQRFPAHWAVGTIADLAGANLHDVYRVASLLCLLAIVLVMHRAFVALRLGPGPYALCIGLVAASAYPMRYLLAAPGMLSDAVFLLGFAMVALGFAQRHDRLVVAGVAIATLGRQTAVPLAFAAALALVVSWERPRALRVAAVTLALGVGVFCAEWIVARRFSSPGTGGFSSFTLLGSLDHPIRLVTREGIASADARAFLGLLVPLGLIAGAWLRGRRPPALPALLAASVLVQPFLLAPAWVSHNETRLAALALPALALVAAYQLRGLKLTSATIWCVAAAILAASFHSRYSDVGVPDSTVWAAIDVVASLSIALAIGWPRIRLRGASEQSTARARAT